MVTSPVAIRASDLSSPRPTWTVPLTSSPADVSATSGAPSAAAGQTTVERVSAVRVGGLVVSGVSPGRTRASASATSTGSATASTVVTSTRRRLRERSGGRGCRWGCPGS